MTEQMIKETVARRIVQHRKRLGMTQLELSEKINYSDKSVSKWERGEGLPDVITLVQLSEIFGISISDFLRQKTEQPEKTTQNHDSTLSRFTWKHYFVTLLSVVGVWLVAFLAICLMQFLTPDIASVWTIRIVCYAAVACFVTWLVLAVLWWPSVWYFICITGIIWSAALSVHMTFQMTGAGMIYVVAGILQVLLMLCYLWKCATEHRWIPLQLFPKIPK